MLSWHSVSFIECISIGIFRGSFGMWPQRFALFQQEVIVGKAKVTGLEY